MKLRPLCFALLLFAAVSGVSRAATNRITASPEVSGLTDSVDVASRSDEAAHAFSATGATSRAVVGDLVGDHDTRRLCRVVEKAARVSYQLRVQPRQSTTLEIEERYGRDAGVRGYLVLVDGRKTYLRTWQGSGAGPVHYFVQLPPQNKTRVRLELVNVGDAPFAISRLWVFADFARYFARGGMDVPYHLAPMMWLNPADFNSDLEKLRRIKGGLSNHPNARAAWGTWITYASLSQQDAERNIDHALRLAEASEMPVQIAFDTWWGSTPNGLDGEGGFWTDVRYQQQVYNASTRRMQLSIPNRWSNTPWLTMNNARLNSFKARRLRESLEYLARRVNELRARGKGRLLLALNLDNEPVYWASGNAGLGNELLQADFNPGVLADARQDGVTLDPRDGLTWTERLWLFRNLTRYHRLIADAAMQGLGRDPAIVSAAGATLPDDLLRHNVYTQAWIANGANQFPIQSSVYPFWESAAPRGARIGGEWNGDSLREREGLQRMIALGRNAAVNAEAGNKAEENAGVRPGYALAQRYYAPYNYPLESLNELARDIRDATQPFPAHRYLPVLGDHLFRDDSWQQDVVSHDGLERGLIGNTAAVALFPASTTRPGQLTYKLNAPRPNATRAAFDGLFIELEGRAFVFRAKDASVHIRVLAGPSADPSQMREMGRIFDNGDVNAVHRIDLSAAVNGLKTAWVRIELHAPGIDETVRSWVSIHHLRFTAPWPADVTRDLPPQDESLLTVRRQNLVVSWRSDAEAAIAELSRVIDQQNSNTIRPGSAGQPVFGPPALLRAAQTAIARGAYAEAYHLANRGLSTALPATFHVAQSGALSPYPVRLETPRPITCILLECGPERVRLRLQADETTAVRVRLIGLAPDTAYTARQSADGEWVVQRGADSTSNSGTSLQTDASGALAWDARAEAPVRFQPSTLVGVFRAVAGNDVEGKSVVIYPPDGSSRATLRIGAATRITRGESDATQSPAALSDLRPGDHIQIKLGADGTAQEIAAQGRTVEGVVREFGQLTPDAMPSIMVAGDDKRFVLDLLAPLHLVAGEKAGDTAPKPITIRAVPLGSVDIRPGDRVRLRVNPVLGRVYELWKIGTSTASTAPTPAR